jgi:hypothetical protein
MGYAIVQHMIVPRTGKRRCLLADILADQDQSRVIASLLEAAYANAVASGDHVFEMLGLPRNGRKFDGPQFLSQKTLLLHFCKVRDHGLGQVLADENPGYASPFDGDITLTP